MHQAHTHAFMFTEYPIARYFPKNNNRKKDIKKVSALHIYNLQPLKKSPCMLPFVERNRKKLLA